MTNLTHAQHAEKRGVVTGCSRHDITFGGGCMNCGWKMSTVRTKEPSRREKAENLRAMGFEIPLQPGEEQL